MNASQQTGNMAAYFNDVVFDIDTKTLVKHIKDAFKLAKDLRSEQKKIHKKQNKAKSKNLHSCKMTYNDRLHDLKNVIRKINSLELWIMDDIEQNSDDEDNDHHDDDASALKSWTKLCVSCRSKRDQLILLEKQLSDKCELNDNLTQECLDKKQESTKLEKENNILQQKLTALELISEECEKHKESLNKRENERLQKKFEIEKEKTNEPLVKLSHDRETSDKLKQRVLTMEKEIANMKKGNITLQQDKERLQHQFKIESEKFKEEKIKLSKKLKDFKQEHFYLEMQFVAGKEQLEKELEDVQKEKQNIEQKLERANREDERLQKLLNNPG